MISRILVNLKTETNMNNLKLIVNYASFDIAILTRAIATSKLSPFKNSFNQFQHLDF